jgi:hypothetical protein
MNSLSKGLFWLFEFVPNGSEFPFVNYINYICIDVYECMYIYVYTFVSLRFDKLFVQPQNFVMSFPIVIVYLL